jgi:hypothetical protein
VRKRTELALWLRERVRCCLWDLSCGPAGQRREPSGTDQDLAASSFTAEFLGALLNGYMFAEVLGEMADRNVDREKVRVAVRAALVRRDPTSRSGRPRISNRSITFGVRHSGPPDKGAIAAPKGGVI